MSPIESLILNIHALLYKKNKYPEQCIEIDKALEFSYGIISFLIENNYNIKEMVERISTEIKYILHSDKFIALAINFLIKKNILKFAIDIMLIEYYFLVGLLTAYIGGFIKHSVLLLILYNDAIKIDHFLYKNDKHIILQLLIDAEHVAPSTGFNIINSFIAILCKNPNIKINFHEYPLLLNWLLELEYIPIIEKLLPKGLFLKDDILIDIFARSTVLLSNESKIYCFKVIKLILPYCSIIHFSGNRNIISILSPNKNKNLNYSDLYKKLSIRKKELVTPIVDKSNIEDKIIFEEPIISLKTKKPKKKKATKEKKATTEATTITEATATETKAATEAKATSSHVSTVIRAVDAMLELTKIATNEEADKIYKSMAVLCESATSRCSIPTAEISIPTAEISIPTAEISIPTAETSTKEEENETRKLAIHQKKIAKRREKLTTFNCILSELYRIVAGVIINNFDNNIRFMIISPQSPSMQFCLIFETNDYSHIEFLIDGLEEIFKNVEFSPMEINIETYPIADIYPSINIKLLLCNAYSKLFDDNNILISARSVNNSQILNYLNMQKISEYKTLFIDTASMVATYPILSPHMAILYQIDNIVSDSIHSQYEIVLYGSYGFGAEISTSDIDICILTSMEDNNYISHLISAFSCNTTFANIKFIPSAFKSPNIIMMDTELYHIDLAFSNVQPIVFNSCNSNILEFLNNKYIELDLIKYSYLFVDQPSVCASYALLLGYHIIHTAPNLKAYNDALIQIKINAIEQKIYGSNTGYLNGATLAIMVLYVVISSCEGIRNDNYGCEYSDDILIEFYKTFSDWDWGTYGLIINSKHPPLKLTKLEIAQAANDTSMKFTMLVDTYGACSSCTIWPDTLYQIQRVFKLHCLGPVYSAVCDNISKLVINGHFSERGLAKKIQTITNAFRRNINCDYAYSHYTSQLLVYPEPCIEGIIICVNVPYFFTGLNYNKFLAIANEVIANEAMHW